jgi:hypothetical protein
VNLTALKAKIAAGVLPSANGVIVDHVRFTSGLCTGCDAPLVCDGIGGVQFTAGSAKHLLHVECYVMWTEACATDL